MHGVEVLGCAVLDCVSSAENVIDVAGNGDGRKGDGELGPFVDVDVEEEGGGEAVVGGGVGWEPDGAAAGVDYGGWCRLAGIVIVVGGVREWVRGNSVDQVLELRDTGS